MVSVGFIGMHVFNLGLFEDRSVKLTILNLGYSVVTINAVAVMMAYWK